MANPEHLAKLQEGVAAWNDWRRENAEIRPDLNKADLTKADLRGADLTQADLTEAVLSKTNLTETDLSDANLSKANLSKADLRRAELRRTDLTKAALRRADLTQANLTEAVLTETQLLYTNFHETMLDHAKFTNATFWGTSFSVVDFSTVIGLESISHAGRSSIDTHSLAMSKALPEIFLRGCGLSDKFIEFIPSLIQDQAIQFFSCFISYSSKDEDFAKRLHADLQDHGVRCWFAPEDMKIGDKIRQRIDESIKVYDKLMIILSERSLQSTWVEDEVESAIEKETRKHSTVLFPIRVDQAIMETENAWATKIRRSRHIGDFSNWKDHDVYQVAFKRLLKDLREESHTETE